MHPIVGTPTDVPVPRKVKRIDEFVLIISVSFARKLRSERLPFCSDEIYFRVDFDAESVGHITAYRVAKLYDVGSRCTAFVYENECLL